MRRGRPETWLNTVFVSPSKRFSHETVCLAVSLGKKWRCEMWFRHNCQWIHGCKSLLRYLEYSCASNWAINAAQVTRRPSTWTTKPLKTAKRTSGREVVVKASRCGVVPRYRSVYSKHTRSLGTRKVICTSEPSFCWRNHIENLQFSLKLTAKHTVSWESRLDGLTKTVEKVPAPPEWLILCFWTSTNVNAPGAPRNVAQVGFFQPFGRIFAIPR